MRATHSLPSQQSSKAWVAPDWPAPSCVRRVVTTRLIAGASQPPFDAFNLGAHCGDDETAVAANRAALVVPSGLPSTPRWLRQVHGNRVAVFDDRPFAAAEPEVADAAVTRSAGVVLCVLTADCLPLLLCADDGSEVAAIHAGWRGLAAGVIESTVASMRASRERLLVWLGPAIGPASYEVGDEVRDAFVSVQPIAAAAFAPTRPGHWRCDLYALARQRLSALGIQSIYGGAFDTLTDARFYSYRRDGKTGRFASLIWIE